MRRRIATACVVAMISGVVWAEPPAPQTLPPHNPHVAREKASRGKSIQTAAPVQQLPAQTMPPVPATLMNSAPVKPNVTLEAGMLTIDAPNSTLSDVLSGVRQATGAAIEGASPSERVAVRLGPGKPEQVLAALLRGTPYNYIILGSFGKPGVVTRVLLTQSSQSGGEPVPGSAGRRSQYPDQPRSAEDNPPESTAPDDVVTQPNADGDAEQAQPQRQPQQDQNPQKTPEQLFRELQQLEQQKQRQPQPN